MALKRKNTSHRDGVYWIPQWQVFRDGKHIGTATKIGTAQDNYPWDWEVINPREGEKNYGHTGLLSEAMQDINDHSKED